MISYERFSEILDEEMELLPEYVFEELNGGVLVDKKANLHPNRLADDLYIMGTYSTSPIMGKQIVIYYGSFAATMGLHGEDDIRIKLRDTLRHEFRHHMETRAGFFGKGTLIDEDKQEMDRYYAMHRMKEEQAEKERLEKERLENERMEKERLEKERLEKEISENKAVEKDMPDSKLPGNENCAEKGSEKDYWGTDRYGKISEGVYVDREASVDTVVNDNKNEEGVPLAEDKNAKENTGFTDTGYRGIKSVVLAE